MAKILRRLKSVGAVFARRDLELLGASKVEVVLGKPMPFPEGADWYCPYQIFGLGNETVQRARGTDSMSALGAALKAIGADLYASSEYKAQKLTWRGQRDLGYPMPESKPAVAAKPRSAPKKAPRHKSARRK